MKIHCTFIALDFIDYNGERLTCVQSMPREGKGVAFVDFTNGEPVRIGLIRDYARREKAYIRLAKRYLARSIPVVFRAA